jgi:23S rRNA pseudouridine1911/1915/1917 synthase
MLRDEIKIIFEDEYFLAINKPSGLVVNKSETQKDSTNTLEGFLEERLPEGLVLDRAGIVHRLDKETSGVILAAKSEEVMLSLQALFKSREIKKEYVACAIGEIKDEKFKIDAPIGRNPNKRTKYSVISGGKAAITDFEKIKEVVIEEQTYTFLDIKPLTGRTHQIRVHLAAYNHPVACDNLYSGSSNFERDLLIFGRLMLHAKKIEFTHPVTGMTMSLQAELPQEFSKYL